MSKWEMVKLGKLCQLITDGDWIESKNQSNNGIRLIQTGNVGIGKYIDKEGKEKYISEDTFSELKCTEIYEGDVLISRLPTPVGRACIIPKIPCRMITAVDCTIIRFFNDKILERYFVYFSQSPNYQNQINRHIVGSTRVRISRKNLESILIPLAPIDVQNHIADTLYKTQEIIHGHKKQLEELDNLIKAIFYDMFGDPVNNVKGWRKEKLLDVCDKITDGTHDTPQRYEQGILFITGKNIRPFNIDLTDIEFVSQKDHDVIYKRCNPEFKDVLYTNIGVNYGTAAINLFDYEFSMKNVALLKYKRNRLTGEYLQCYLNYKREYIIDQNKTGGAQTFMGLATIKQLDIFIPPIELQNKFAEIVTNIEEQKAIVKQSIIESENLFNCLMSRYFD